MLYIHLSSSSIVYVYLFLLSHVVYICLFLLVQVLYLSLPRLLCCVSISLSFSMLYIYLSSSSSMSYIYLFSHFHSVYFILPSLPFCIPFSSFFSILYIFHLTLFHGAYLLLSSSSSSTCNLQLLALYHSRLSHSLSSMLNFHPQIANPFFNIHGHTFILHLLFLLYFTYVVSPYSVLLPVGVERFLYIIYLLPRLFRDPLQFPVLLFACYTCLRLSCSLEFGNNRTVTNVLKGVLYMSCPFLQLLPFVQFFFVRDRHSTILYRKIMNHIIRERQSTTL